MRKCCKRVVTIVLALVLALTACVPAFAAGDVYKPFRSYLCIGDSIAAGCALKKDGTETQFSKEGIYSKLEDTDLYWGYDYSEIDTAYHGIVAKKLSDKFGQPTELIQAARSGLRAAELRYMLDGTYNEYDEDMTWGNTYFYFEDGDDTFTTDDLDAMNARFKSVRGMTYAEAIKTAELITLNVGSNDVFSTGLSLLSKQLEDGSITGLDEQFRQEVIKVIDQNTDLGAALVQIIELKGSLDDMKKIITAVTLILEKNFAQFQTNYNTVLQYIQKVNPKATVLLVGVYNPLSGIKLSTQDSFLWNFLNSAIDPRILLASMTSRINQYLQTAVSTAALGGFSQYAYVDVQNTEVYESSLDEVYFWNNFGVKCHPTLAGHRYMATQILNALKKTYVDGDLNSDRKLTDADAIYLWNHVASTDSPNQIIAVLDELGIPTKYETYPVTQDVDYNNDGEETSDDAIYLLNYTLNPDRYPVAWWN